MPSRRLPLVVLLVGLSGAVPISAAAQRPARQTVSGPAISGDAPADAEALFRSLSDQLKALITAQDQVRSERGGFALAFGTGDQSLAFVPTQGVSISLGYGDSLGWTATASHVLLPGKSCVVWVGRIPPPRRPATRFDGNQGGDAEVVCDLVP